MARILTVDDHPFMTRIIANCMEQHGHEVARAATGREALDLLNSAVFDVLITDVDMPEMDGLTLIRQERVLAGLRGVVVITGRDDYRNLTGMHTIRVHVLPKPFSPSHLARLIELILAGDSPPTPRASRSETLKC